MPLRKPKKPKKEIADVVIIGGGPAGLSAALILGRSRRKVIVIDDGRPRNLQVRKSHGFLTRDGTPPAEILRIARDQLKPYDIAFCKGRAVNAAPSSQGFKVTTKNGKSVTARTLLLAAGVSDDLPDVPGLKEKWGTSIFSCPYCDGWEWRDKPLAIVGAGRKGYAFAVMLRHWSRDIVLCLDGGARPGKKQLDHLREMNIAVIQEKIVAYEGKGGALRRLRFSDGNSVARGAVFLHPPCHLKDMLAKQLGYSLGRGGQIVVDPWGASDIKGLYVAGDAVTRESQVITAAASGAVAAFAINRALIAEDHAPNSASTTKGK